jgi:hypothetical protein
VYVEASTANPTTREQDVKNSYETIFATLAEILITRGPEELPGDHVMAEALFRQP